jgi:predicted DNA-binding transcriptional regulator AlpA
MAPRYKLAASSPIPKVQSDRRAMSMSEFARSYGISVTTVWRAVRDGRLRTVQIGKRKKLILLDSVEASQPREHEVVEARL